MFIRCFSNYELLKFVPETSEKPVRKQDGIRINKSKNEDFSRHLVLEITKTDFFFIYMQQKCCRGLISPLFIGYTDQRSALLLKLNTILLQ